MSARDWARRTVREGSGPRLLSRTVVVVLVLGALACIHRPPNPQPTPTPAPTPTPTPLPMLLLRQPEPPRLVRDGQPFTPFGAIQCCMGSIETASKELRPPRRPLPFHPGRTAAACNTLWPLASECWMDYTHAKGANLFHFRMGPFYGDAAHESDWAAFGGPYAGGPGSDWNPTFWQKYRELLQHAREIGANVEVVTVDTWYCKHAQWGDQEMPWPAADIDACGRRPSPEQERYIRKVVSEAKDAPHVIWITDNEGDQIQGDDCAWFEWNRSVIRDEEAKSGGATRMVGTNNVRCGGGSFDYVATHARSALAEPIAGKHTENNERNPSFSPEQEYANFCRAQAAGLHWWFWRAEMTDAELEETLNLFGRGCGGPVGCFAPGTEDPLWAEPPVAGGGEMRDAVNAAKAAVGEHCGTDHQGSLDTLGLLAAELRRQGYCASGPWTDAVVILTPSGKWEEYHAVTFATGCWAQDPAQLPKFTWEYLGTNPQPEQCPVDVPQVDEILCRLHQATNYIVDCTPKANSQPILPEGDPNRWACELKAMGGAPPVYSLRVDAGALALVTRENPMQFQITGSGSGFVTCTIPAGGPFCNLAVSR